MSAAQDCTHSRSAVKLGSADPTTMHGFSGPSRSLVPLSQVKGPPIESIVPNKISITKRIFTVVSDRDRQTGVGSKNFGEPLQLRSDTAYQVANPDIPRRLGCRDQVTRKDSSREVVGANTENVNDKVSLDFPVRHPIRNLPHNVTHGAHAAADEGQLERMAAVRFIQPLPNL